MNINEMFLGLTGKNSPFDKILKLIGKIVDKLDDLFTRNKECCDALKEELDQIRASLTRIEAGDTAWQNEVSDTLARIEDAVSSGQAAHLVIQVGVPEEQP